MLSLSGRGRSGAREGRGRRLPRSWSFAESRELPHLNPVGCSSPAELSKASQLTVRKTTDCHSESRTEMAQPAPRSPEEASPKKDRAAS